MRKHNNGSSIVEFGPALWLFFVIIFFPMLMTLWAIGEYAAGWYFNYTACNRIARVNQVNGVAEFTNVSNDFANSGIGKFLGLTSSNITMTSLQYIPAQFSVNATVGMNEKGFVPAMPAQVILTSTVNVQPLFNIPWFQNGPGFNKQPIPFTYTMQLACEACDH